MFHYLRRDHRGHKEDKDRLPISAPHLTLPHVSHVSKDKTVQQDDFEKLPHTAGAVNSSPWIDLKDSVPLADDSPTPDFLPPLSFLSPLTEPSHIEPITKSSAGSEMPSHDLQPKEQPPRPKTSSKMASSLSLSRGISKKKKKEKPPKVDTNTPQISSSSLNSGRPQTSPPSKADVTPPMPLTDTKPSSPWKLGFGSSKSKDANRASATAVGPSSSNATTHQRASQGKEMSPQANQASPSKLLNDSPKSQDGETTGMSFVRHSTTKSPHTSSSMHHPHDASSKEKRRLNLLNPMALLGRRRSAQNSTARQEDDALPALPDDYDPRIRGRYIHDFSSPRPRNPPPLNVKRANEYGLDSNLETPHAHEVPLPPSATDTSFQCDSSQLREEEQRCTSALPSPVGIKSSQLSESARETDAVSDLPSDALNGDSQKISLSIKSKASSRHSALGLPKHAPSTTSRFSFDMGGGEPSAQERLLEEKHKEKEAEDRAKRIEERIKNPHMKRDSESTFDDLGEFDDFDYDAMLDEDDGGYEERIPGVNADPDEDDDRFPAPMTSQSAMNQRQPVYDENGFSATPFATLTTAQQSSTEAAAPALFSMVSPVDENDQSMLSDFSLGGMRPGSGLPKNTNGSTGDIRDSVSSAPNGFMHSPLELSRVNTHENINLFAQPGYGVNPVDQASYGITQNLANLSLQDNSASNLPTSQAEQQRISLSQPLDDDLYFDDGMFGELQEPAPGLGDPSNGDGVPFDENIFDDENSYLYDRKRAARAASLEKAAQAQAQSKKQVPSLPAVAESPLKDHFSTDVRPEEDDVVQYDPDQFGKKMPLRPHNTFNDKAPPHNAVNKEVNAYHTALVEAMQKAALEGRFDRADSFSEPDGTMNNEQAPNSKTSPTDSFNPSSTCDQFHSEPDDLSSLVDDFEYDNLDDDDENIIAAANAEALENDDDGFYGLEFGFYANVPPNTKANTDQMIYGGYFGERGINMDEFTEGKNGLVHRSHSGRAADFQEPSLTPITERSEWSNRNSMHSLPHSFPVGTTPAAASSSIPSSSPLSHMTDAGQWSSPANEPDTPLRPYPKRRRDIYPGNGNLYNHNNLVANPSGNAISKPRTVSTPVTASPRSRHGSMPASSPLYLSSLSRDGID